MFVQNYNRFNNSTHGNYCDKTNSADTNRIFLNGHIANRNYSAYVSSIKTNQRKNPYIQNEIIMRQSAFEPVISVRPKSNNKLNILNLNDYLKEREYPIENSYVSKLEVKLCTKSTTLKFNRDKFQIRNSNEIQHLPNERSIHKSSSYKK